MPQGKGQSAEQLKLLWQIAGMAFMVSAEVAAGAGIGWLIDRWRGASDQLGMIIGGIVGIIVGLYGFLRAAFKLSRGSSRSGQPPSTPPKEPRQKTP